jgi:transcriptional regulator with XRE-family HTH domain
MPIKHMPVKHHHASRPFDGLGALRDNGGMKQLARIRRNKGLTQAQLAEMAGLDQGTISNMERDPAYNFTGDAIYRIAAALAVEPAELFGLPELQERIIRAIRAIDDPERQAAALVVLESMAAKT